EAALAIGADAICQALSAMRERSATDAKVAAKTPLSDAEYEALGFLRTELGWVFPTGDADADKVLASFARDQQSVRCEAAAGAARRRRQAHGLGIQAPDRPPIEDIEAEEITPGTYRWRERGGTLVRVHFRGRRLA